MKIMSSNVGMSSERMYLSQKVDLFSYSGWGNETAASTLPTAKESVQQIETQTKRECQFCLTLEEKLEDLEREQKVFKKKQTSFERAKKSSFQAKNPVEYDTFRNLLLLLFGTAKEKTDWSAEFRRILARRREDFS
ncbi:MAG: hypothetical protein PWP24_292 [Clostridiales bacterium]|nr:hypothetical protein [Clostridiales bacterium]